MTLVRFVIDIYMRGQNCLHLSDVFIQSDLQAIHLFMSMCVPWELNPQPFALLTQVSTTEPQEHLQELGMLSNFCISLIKIVLLLKSSE